LDGSQSASFLHERVAELEATAEKSKLKVNSYASMFCAGYLHVCYYILSFAVRVDRLLVEILEILILQQSCCGHQVLLPFMPVSVFGVFK